MATIGAYRMWKEPWDQTKLTASFPRVRWLKSFAVCLCNRELPRPTAWASTAGQAESCISASWCYDADMAKVRTTLTIDETVLRAVKVRAARSGKGDSEVIEEALRRELGLDLLERLWERNKLPEQEAVALAVEAQHASRRRQRR
jgi:hypothetical protein